MKLLAAATALMFTACSSSPVSEYAATTPNFDLKQYFNGEVEAWGQFQDRSGKLVKRFYVHINASWQDNKGVLDEQFKYDDGSTQQRIWQIEYLGNGQYTGRANDVVGIAKGSASGSVLNWHYTLALPVNGKTYHVQFDDWMFLHDQQTLVNRAVMSKFGFKLGEVTFFFKRKTS